MSAKFEFRKIGTSEKLPYKTRTYDKTVMVPTVVKQALWDSSNTRMSVPNLNTLGLEILVTPDPTPAEVDYDHFTNLYATESQMAVRVGEYKTLLDGLPNLIVPTSLVVGTTNGSPNLSVANWGDVKPIVGSAIQGTGIPSGATIVSFDATTLVISDNATADGADVTVTLDLVNYQAGTDDIRAAIVALGLTDVEELAIAEEIETAFHNIKVNYQYAAATTSYMFVADDFTTWNAMNKMVYYLPSNGPFEPERSVPFIWTDGMDNETETPPYPID